MKICPMCDGATTYILKDYSEDIKDIKIYKCLYKDCEFSWLPIEEEAKIDEQLKKGD